MHTTYERYHEIIARLVAGEPGADSDSSEDDDAGLTPDEVAGRAAFIRVMKEELDRLGRA